MYKKKNKFTIIELLAVIAIISILIGLLNVGLVRAKKNSRRARYKVFVENLRADPNLILQMTLTPKTVRKDPSGKYEVLNTALGLKIKGYKSEKLNGQLTNADIIIDGGRWGKPAIFFYGNDNSYMQINDSDLLTMTDVTDPSNPRPKNFSAYIWFKALKRSSHYARFISKGMKSSKDEGWMMFLSNHSYWIQFTVAGTKYKYKTDTDKHYDILGKWHMMAFVVNKDKNIVNIYVDGKKTASKELNFKPAKKPINPISQYTLVGKGERPGYSFRGYIDELEVFDRALTDREIANAYEMGVE
jgi:prepilin-type N-terminal cleavage/methylation domain-containing protein